LIRIGTRGSALALAQARWVAERLADDTELVTVTTAGDRGASLDDKSQWVTELEQALLEERIDVAVHSAKDVPAELAEGLELVAIPARADPRDAICGAPSLEALPPRARIGTSSLRRQAQLRAAREDIDVVATRGNVDTRLRKLADGQYDALVLAVAGLRRLGHEPDGILDELVPAAGQGALALEARTSDEQVRSSTRDLQDERATACVLAERELTKRLGASCNSAVGANARPAGDRELELRAWAGLADGSGWISDRRQGEPAGLGAAVAERMLAVGAEGMLR
jgi:hydroxymethylbilane synthase